MPPPGCRVGFVKQNRRNHCCWIFTVFNSIIRMEKQTQEIKENENLDEEIIEEESKFSKIIKKTFIILMTFIILLLLLSYLLPSAGLITIISSRFDSYEINNNEIILKNNNKIIFERNTFNDLLKIYNENQQHEFKACLIGNKENNNYKINRIDIPKIFYQDFSSVRSEPCSKNTIISLHSHPFKRCYFSVHDVNNYRLVRSINKEAIIGIMCEPERFNFYGFR